jgi:uncharacterized protein YjaG (DUF416 family)
MTVRCIDETFDLFSSLTEQLHSYMKSGLLEKAIKVAQQRHSILVSLMESAASLGLDQSKYLVQAMECVGSEQSLAKVSASQSRSDFVSRKTAYKAYSTLTA